MTLPFKLGYISTNNEITFIFFFISPLSHSSCLYCGVDLKRVMQKNLSQQDRQSYS